MKISDTISVTDIKKFITLKEDSGTQGMNWKLLVSSKNLDEWRYNSLGKPLLIDWIKEDVTTYKECASSTS